MPGVGDHHVDAAQLVGGPVDQREDRVAVGDVGGHRDRAAPGGGDLLGDGLGARLVHVVDGDGVPVAGQPQRDAAADPRPAPVTTAVLTRPRSFGSTRIFTFSSLLSISSRKPFDDEVVERDPAGDELGGVDLLVAQQADGRRVVARSRRACR